MVNVLNEALKAGEDVRSNREVKEGISALKELSEARLKANEGDEPSEPSKISLSLTKIFEPWKSYMGEERKEVVIGDYTGREDYSLNVEQDRNGNLKIMERWREGQRETEIWSNEIMVSVYQQYCPYILTSVEVSENHESFFQKTILSLQQAIENPSQFPIPEICQIFNATVGFANQCMLPPNSTLVEEAVTVKTKNGSEKSVEYYFEVSNEESNRQGQGNGEMNNVPEMQVSFYYKK